MDDIYFKIKDMYDNEEENGFADTATDTSNDDETFGWSLANEWIAIGNVFFFLLSIYNLIDVADESNIYDSKGIIVGKVQYGMGIKIFDSDKKTPLNLMDYETMDELHNKWMQLSFHIKKAVMFNEKYTYRTKCTYKWIKEEQIQEETLAIEQQKQPQFNYSKEFMLQIDSSVIQYFMFNQLIIQVWGMIESKQKKKINDDSSNYQDYTDNEQTTSPNFRDKHSMKNVGQIGKGVDQQGSCQHCGGEGNVGIKKKDTANFGKADAKTTSDETKRLLAENAELQKKLKQAEERYKQAAESGNFTPEVKGSACCSLF